MEYMIEKDGMWLMGYQPSGHKEVIGDGRLVDVPTCIWGEHIREAMRFDDRSLAEHIAKVTGAALMKTEK